jgi:uncharacterized membrane protein YraQ (UPF0718 family)
VVPVSVSREARISNQRVATVRLIAGASLFLLLAIIGLFIVKWSPYWLKAHGAALHHTIGSSIVSGKSSTAPAVGWQAAWSYAVSYFKAVWEAVLLALVLGASVQVFVPRRWLHRLLGAGNKRSVALAGMFSLAGMM